MGHRNILSVHTGERAGRRSAEPFEMGEDTASGFPLSGGRIHQIKYVLYPGRCALSLEPSRREAVGDLADPSILEPRWEMQGGEVGRLRGALRDTKNRCFLAHSTPL